MNTLHTTIELGDCFEIHFQILNGTKTINHGFKGDVRLIHAEVSGQGELEGVRYAHCWIEDDINAYDYSNGTQFIVPKNTYHNLAKADVNNPSKFYIYTNMEAFKKALQYGTYGTWDLETEN